MRSHLLGPAHNPPHLIKPTHLICWSRLANTQYKLTPPTPDKSHISNMFIEVGFWLIFNINSEPSHLIKCSNVHSWSQFAPNPTHLINSTHFDRGLQENICSQFATCFPPTHSIRVSGHFRREKGLCFAVVGLRPTSSWTAATRPFSPPLASFPFLLLPPSLLPLRRLLVDTYCLQGKIHFKLVESLSVIYLYHQ